MCRLAHLARGHTLFHALSPFMAFSTFLLASSWEPHKTCRESQFGNLLFSSNLVLSFGSFEMFQF
ncbi:hypothetical protein BT69DRAFT_1283373 [Atractiella rhizophila]|nr:hypothetical protein BT69DRAFT_1283373 [Atractiella rhizophila]